MISQNKICLKVLEHLYKVRQKKSGERQCWSAFHGRSWNFLTSYTDYKCASIHVSALNLHVLVLSNSSRGGADVIRCVNEDMRCLIMGRVCGRGLTLMEHEWLSNKSSLEKAWYYMRPHPWPDEQGAEWGCGSSCSSCSVQFSVSSIFSYKTWHPAVKWRIKLVSCKPSNNFI